jgi:TolB protein
MAAGAQPVTERRNLGSQKYAGAAQGGNYMHNYYLPPAPSSTPWAPAWAPDGKTVAIGLYGSIWRVDVNTGVAAELTYNSRYHSMPAWSPDGRWLIYTADEEHKRIQLEALDVATGQTMALTDDPFVYMDPAFSPDGKSLAYVASKPNGSFHVYVRGIADGKWTGEEIPITRDNRYPRNRLYVGQTDMHIEPAWMSGGKELLLVSNRGISLGSGGIWRVPAERYGMDKGKLILNEQTLFRTRPEISIDGKRFIYSSSSGAADQYHLLYVLPAGGGYPYKMTFGDHEDFHPRWSPDGEYIAYISNERGLPQLVVMETYGGRKRTVNITDLKWKRPMGTLSVKVVDDKTGKPVYARIQGVAADGKFYTPRDAYSRVSGPGHVFHTTGAYTVSMPPGKFKLQVVHGFEYFPQDVELDVPADKRKEVTVRLKRMADLNAKGWYSGSTHVHMNYGGNLHNTLENLVMMSKAEDQDVVNELVANKDNRVMDWQYFVSGGGEHPVSKGDPDIKVLVSQEYRPPFYGHVFMLGLRDYLISPFLTGYEATGVDSLYPSNTDMFRKALNQGAVTGYVHPFSGDRDPLEAGLGSAGAKGLPVDAALGTAQCQEWSASSKAGLLVWHHLLNNDLRITPTGGEDSISNLHDSKLVGSVRTYAYVGADFSVPAWLNALRKGHTFFTSGPLTDLKINGKIPGDEIKLPAKGGTISLQASVQSIAPLSKAVIYHNGQVWKELPLHADQKSATFTAAVPVTASGWYALYAEGPKSDYLDVAYSQASTNAIRVYVGDQKIRNTASAEYFVKWIDQLHDLAEEWPFWRSQAEKDHVYAQFRQARSVYTDLLK